ncbi:hypothetical protein [Methanoculleus frigidifontis]|uniref:hypothetical protein n=1 Tax=Methanoculleus frigidifontis TaxID=2584085 RepID=UPI002657B3AB|nr:hypothetical protein [Methanoculleus sp. FWC-SCC1]
MPRTLLLDLFATTIATPFATLFATGVAAIVRRRRGGGLPRTFILVLHQTASSAIHSR